MQQRAFRSILLISKEHQPQAQAAAQRMAAWLEARGVESRTVPSRLDHDSLREAGMGMDAAIVLGGDGAVLGVGRALVGLGVPLLGVNFGRVGFLTEIPAHGWEPWLEDLLAGKFLLQQHLALSWELAGGPEFLRGWAINDVVVARGEMARAISLELSIDGIPLSRLRCDGLIVSAPLGATAYAASAHGPLAVPSLHAQIITPISPFAGAFPPLVVTAESRIRLTSPDGGSFVRITVDGQENMPMDPDHVLEVCGAPCQMPILVRDPKWYLRRLVDRGFIQPGPGLHTRDAFC